MKKIEASDIRLNNWIEFKGENIQAMGIDFDDYRSDPAEYIINNRAIIAYNAIPLTHDWLMKFGFETGNTIDSYYKGDLGQIFLRLPHMDSKHYLVKASHDVNITSIQYVHQLQNFYHAITGGDL